MNIKKEFTYILRRVIVAIIIILILAFIDNLKPRALEMKSSNITSSNITGHDRVYGGAYLKDNVNLATNQDFSFTFSGSNNITGYDYITMGLQMNFNLNGYEYTTESGSSSETTDTPTFICSRWGINYQTYADGTQSTYYLCEEWVQYSSTNNTTQYGSTSTTESHYRPDIGLSIYLIYNDNSFSPCEINSVNYGNTFITCKIPNGVTNFTSIRFRNVGSSYYSSLPSSIGIQTYWSAWKDPSTTLAENQEDTTNAINNVNNSIKDSSVDSNTASSTINNASALLPTDNSISNLIGLPITFVQAVNNGITGTCKSIHLFDLKMSELENSTSQDWSFNLPCLDLSSILGDTWVIIDTIMSALLVYAMAKFFIRTFVKLTQLDSNIVKEAYDK